MDKNNIQKVGIEVIQYEINALQKLKSNIGRSFDKVVKLLLSLKNGKVIISGVGKSGIIARKWSATLSSVGIPSFFLDPTNASHGDMGQITSNDLVILISNSGQSEELKNIIQYTVRNKNIKLIGITSKKDSLLYKNSNQVFLIPSIKEAGPENIVPTSSTTSQLALGDAIAIACMKYRKFTKLDFKKFHPSGTLSIKLKTVEDLMITGNKIPIISTKSNMKKAISIINKKKLGVVIIKDKKGNTVGIITDGDLKRMAQKYQKLQSLELNKVMKKNPVSIEKDKLAANALSIMNSKKITSLCVHKKNNKKKTIGLIHVHDILKSNIN